MDKIAEETSTGFQLSDDGHEEETPEQLKTVQLKLQELKRGDGTLVRLTQQELSLLQKMLTAPEAFRDMQVFLIADFMDEDEARDHVAAYFEAKEIGMDTDENIALMFALCATNRKGIKSNRVAMLLDSLQHFKYTTNVKDGKKGGQYINPRSPLSG